jgi:hypothetical protein
MAMMASPLAILGSHSDLMASLACRSKIAPFNEMPTGTALMLKSP